VRKGFLSAAVLIIFFAINAHAGTEKPLSKARLLPVWLPQAQFTGYYVALEKGFYKKYGLDLEIITGGPDRSPDEFLERKKADFVLLWLPKAIQMRARGIKLVNLAQIVQRSGLMLIAKKSCGITTPLDIQGKKVGLWGPAFQLQPRAFFKKFGLQVKEIPQSSSVNLFLRGGVDVASAMWYNEYHTIINSGLDPEELTTFFFHEYDLNFPEDGIYVLEETCQKIPEACCAVVKASIEGWTYAFDHPDEALNIMAIYMKKAHVPTNMTHQKWMMNRMKDLILPKTSNATIGKLMLSDYDRVARILQENGMIGSIPSFDAFSIRCDGID
jgi:NitT/TauT family transport system substrate-binding protein